MESEGEIESLLGWWDCDYLVGEPAVGVGRCALLDRSLGCRQSINFAHGCMINDHFYS
ncbi:hypothetical protein [Rubritalea tangerina]|uniref:hypothetical protein n=1 Tax=Rubritalea tangerina TaxID=430798 RepID=UPI00361C4656